MGRRGNNKVLQEAESSLSLLTRSLQMKCIPILRCSDPERSLHFYTHVLDFTLKYANNKATDPVVTLINNGMEMQLCGFDGSTSIIINILVNDVDALFAKYTGRGLQQPGKKGSPVHQSPIDQTWGMREFYVTDADGHTLRFGQPIQEK